MEAKPPFPSRLFERGARTALARRRPGGRRAVEERLRENPSEPAAARRAPAPRPETPPAKGSRP